MACECRPSGDTRTAPKADAGAGLCKTARTVGSMASTSTARAVLPARSAAVATCCRIIAPSVCREASCKYNAAPWRCSRASAVHAHRPAPGVGRPVRCALCAVRCASATPSVPCAARSAGARDEAGGGIAGPPPMRAPRRRRCRRAAAGSRGRAHPLRGPACGRPCASLARDCVPDFRSLTCLRHVGALAARRLRARTGGPVRGRSPECFAVSGDCAPAATGDRLCLQGGVRNAGA